MKIETNKGKVFDCFLNIWINFVLWTNGVDDNKDIACDIATREINRIKRFMNWQ